MRKITAKLLIFLLIIKIITPILSIGDVFAVSNTWDFNTNSNYTLSDTNVNNIKIENSLVRLPYHLEHLWAITDSTNLNWARRVLTKWDYAFVASYDADKIISLNISDPTNPTIAFILSNWDQWININWPKWLSFTWNYLYVAGYLSDNISIIDISDPTNLVFVQEIADDIINQQLNWANDITIDWSHLYVSSYVDDSFNIFDNTDPSNPTFIQYLKDTTKLDWINRSKINWGYAYSVMDRNDSFSIIDLTNQDSSFQKVSIVWELTDWTNWALLNWARWISLSWNIAYVSSNISDALELIDITDKTTPIHTWSIVDWNWWATLNANRQVITYNWYAFNSARISDAIEVVDLSNPTLPTHESNILKDTTVLLNWANDIYNSWSIFYAVWNVDDSLEIMKVKYSTNSPYVIPTNPYNYTWSINSFNETLWLNNQWNISYQLSYDNWINWYWYDWTDWLLTNTWTSESNSAININNNLYSFNNLNKAWTWSFLFKAFLNSDWTQKVELDKVNITTIESPTEISNPVFWYDWQDTDWDWDSTNEPTVWTEVSPLIEKFNWYSAYNNTAWTIPTYNTWAINNHPNLNYDWVDNNYIIDNQTAINTASSYYEKSFSIVFKTSDDINTFQNIYEQWWTARGYNIQVENGHLYAWAFNTSEWVAWDQYKFVDLWTVNPNQTYYLTMIQESTNSKTLKVYLDSNLVWDLQNVDYQRSHWWAIWLWFVNWNIIKASDNSTTNWPAYFKWNIWEFISWNHALSDIERQWIDMYLKNKWWLIFQIYPSITWTNINNNQLFTSSSWLTIEYYYKDWDWWNWIDTASANLALYRIDWWIWSNDLTWSLIDSNQTNITTSTWTFYATWIWQEWYYKASVSISNLDWNSIKKDIYFSIDPLWIKTKVLHFDLQDPNWNSWTTLPTSWTWLSLIKDKILWYDAYQNTSWNQAIYYDSWIINPPNPWIVLDWIDDFYNIDNESALNTTNYYEKSFSFVFKTGDDIDTYQNIYEQWWGSRWYAIQIQSWAILAWAWNNVEWASWDQYKTLTWTIQANTIYTLTMVQDSTDSNLANTKFEVYLDWVSLWTLNNIDYQRPHTWNIAIWEVLWWAIKLSDNTSSSDWNYFKWSIWEIISWNHALTLTEEEDIETYFKNRWNLDKISPTITNNNFASWSILPWWNHNLEFSFNDNNWWVWIDTSSALIWLAKWDSTNSVWNNVSNEIWTWTITDTWATYPTYDLNYGKYEIVFQIDDKNWNSTSTWYILYIDKPEIIISTWSIDIWELNDSTNTFAQNIIITVKTIWSWFNVQLKKNTQLTTWTDFIPYYDWSLWFGYDKNKDWTLFDFNDDIIWQEIKNINTNWNLNTYTYTVSLWAIIEYQQAWWDYSWKIDFWINLDY